MGHQRILQKNGPLTTEIAILNLERSPIEISIVLVKMVNVPYHGLPIHITGSIMTISFQMNIHAACLAIPVLQGGWV